jgi:glycosyltransferase involved in cell wall biosynthesis
MDDAVAMAPPGQREAMLRQEGLLVSDSSRVIVSSHMLRERLLERFGPGLESKLFLVQNGVDASLWGRVRISPPSGNEGRILVGYAGTVASWFDFDAVLSALEDCHRIHVRIIGPRTGREPVHTRIEYVPPVGHGELSLLLSECNALIMPFRVDSIVTAVNPVKLYEYLLYGVPVIASRYDEIEEEFEGFVEFFESPEGLARLFDCLQAGELQVRAEPSATEAFVRNASWSRRWRQIRSSGRPE